MKFQDFSNKEKKRKPLFLVIFFLIILVTLSFFIKINKFEYEGDLQYIDLRVLKILSQNLLKDQAIFWVDRSRFENELKSELPQIKELSYQILNSSTLKISIKAENICCVISDSNEKTFVIASDGLVIRELEGKVNKDLSFQTREALNLNQTLNKNLIQIVRRIYNNEIKFEDVKDNQFFLENSSIYFYNNDSKQVIINENSDFVKFSDKYKSIKSHLEQNQKNYSILDFRFEKIVVK